MHAALEEPPQRVQDVAVRGEIGGDGEFAKWDEETWERKRQQLDEQPMPWPDFPFPGSVATDRLHWLRQELKNAAERADREKSEHLLKRIIDRTEAAGDSSAAARWRSVLVELATKPAPSKSK